MSTRWRLPRALLGAVTALVLLGACITPGSEDSSSGPSSSRSAPSSPAPSSPTPSSSTPEPTHEPRGKGARALVQEPGAATWRMISSPERAYTTEGALTPSPARAEHDEGIGYERGCQAPREMTTFPTNPCVVGDVSGETEVAVVGDSKMLQWLPAIDPIARAEGWRVTVLTKSACGLTLRGQYEECAAYNRAMLRQLITQGLRRMTQHGNTRLAHWQYLDRDGVDLGDVAEGRTVNPDLPTPPNLEEMVEIAERLSVAVPTPMIRVDLYDTSEGVRLGEFTVMPGGKQYYRADHDLALGTLWDRAVGRLQRDLANGRPFALLRGEHPVRTPHEPTHASGVSSAH